MSTSDMHNAIKTTNMYAFKVENESASLWYGQKLLFDELELILNLGGGEEVILLPSAMDEENSIRFAGDKVAASLDLTSRGRLFLLGCTLTLEQHPFQHNTTIHPEKGITIRCKGPSGLKRWHAAYRHKDWWSRPAFGEEISGLPGRTQSLVWQTDETHWYAIALSDRGYTAALKGNGESLEISLASYCSGMSSLTSWAVAIGSDEDPYRAVEQTIGFAQQQVGTLLPLYKRERSALLSGFGWCSWDAFYHAVDEKGILAKVKELKAKKIPVQWVLIDDGWLQESDKGLTSFQEDPVKFPSGFKALVKTFKEEYGIKHVGVWHAFGGYWGGVAPNSPLALQQGENLLTTPSGRLVPHPEKGKAFAFWNSWYEYLAEQGLDFVKVDGQSGVTNQYRYVKATPKAAEAVHSALEAAASLHLPLGVINCMGMATENIWNRRISTISRNSDDYVPQDASGFAEHAAQNVYNSLYHGQFYVGDWDMFWTLHPQRLSHGLLRSIGGGPVYISDPVGTSDAAFLESLLFSDGSVASCDGIAVPAEEVLFTNPLKERILLKVTNTAQGVPCCAFFNLHQDGPPIKGDITLPKEVERGYFFDVINKQLHKIQADRPVKISLSAGGASLYQIAVARHGMAAIGLLEKFVPQAGIRWVEVQSDSLLCKVRDKGTFGFVCEQEIQSFTINGKSQITHLKPIEGCTVGFCAPCEADDVIFIQTKGEV